MSQSKKPRKRTPPEVELRVLEQSRRRCALCFHLNADLREKHGQIAHLNQDWANYAEDKHIVSNVAPTSAVGKLYDLKMSVLHELRQALTKGHYEINRRAKAVMPRTEEEFRTQVEVHEFNFLGAMTMAEIYLDEATRDLMRVVLGSLRQMCTSIWLRSPAVFEVHGRYADPEIREPDWKLFTESFEAAKAALATMLNPKTAFEF
jgi:hypothetical protein